MTSGYDYRVLQIVAREIRVLRVETGPGKNDNGLLRVRLEHISLAKDPVERFIAVSYHWGTNRRRERVIIDGQIAKVPKTAADAIRNLSKATPHPLWIDAISINQSNLQEKSEQVAMMKDVYSSASSVFIWLGAACKSTPAAMESIEMIHGQCMQITDGSRKLHDYLYGTDGSPGFKYSDEPLPPCNWPAIRKFYSAPWFVRLWVIQEIGLARDSRMYTDNMRPIDADKVVLAARWMVHRRYARHFGGAEISGIESASDMYRPAGRPLWNQLRRTHRAICSKPQDRVYGLLGLLPTETASAVTASYTKPLVEVYAEAIRLALFEARDLTFLQFVAWYKSPEPPLYGMAFHRLICWLTCSRMSSLVSNEDQWPSWVLKLHGEISDQRGSCRNTLVFGRSETTVRFDLQTKIMEAGLTLTLKGVSVDSITSVGPIFTSELLKNFPSLAGVVMHCVRLSHQGSVLDETTFAKDMAFCLTCGSNQRNSDAELNENHIAAFEAFLEQCTLLTKSRGRWALPRSSSGQPGLPSRDSLTYWPDLWSKALNRRFFVTSTGMIGMGPPATEIADIVCLFYGSEAPFLLRPLSHYYEMLGDAYVRTQGRSCNAKLWSEAIDKNSSDHAATDAEPVRSFARLLGAERWFDII